MGDSCPIQTGRQDILATAYLKPGKTLVSLASWAQADARVRLHIDWPALGMAPQKAVLRAPAIAGFQAAQTFLPGDEIAVPQKRGWLLILEERK